MPLLSLPDELLVAVSKRLPSFPHLQPISQKNLNPIIELNPALRALCATNMRLRAIFVHELYANIVFNLRRKALRTHWGRVRQFLQVMETRGSSRLIRWVTHTYVHVQVAHASVKRACSIWLLGPFISMILRRYLCECLLNNLSNSILEA